MELNDAIEELNKVSANLELLKNKWNDLEELLSYPVEGHYDQSEKQQYDIGYLEFAELLEEIPPIRGIKIQNCLPTYNEVSQWARDVTDLGEASAFTSFISEVYQQGPEISKYEILLKKERRKLIRNQVSKCIDEVDGLLDSLEIDNQEENLTNPIKPEIIDFLRDKVRQIDVLMGDSVPRPQRWQDLERHLYWGQINDLNDIILMDWPLIKPSLETIFQGNDPFSIDAKDIGELIDNANKTGEIGTILEWNNITFKEFERLCADLLKAIPNCENVEWLTPTTASDRGRDITAFWVTKDITRGTIREKTLIQCKHKPNGSLSPSDISDLQNLFLTHGNVDLCIIITSGKFSDQTTQVVENWNTRNTKPKVELWEQWKLEQLLASYPYIIKIYGL